MAIVVAVAGCVAGVVAAGSTFPDPGSLDWTDPAVLATGWARLGVVLALVSVALAAVLWLQRWMARRVLFCVLIGLVAHLALGLYLHDQFLALLVERENARRAELLKQPEPLIVPDYNLAQIEPSESKQGFEEPVETPSPEQIELAPQKQSLAHQPLLEKPAPADEPSRTEPPDPAALDRAEPAVPRRALEPEAIEISRQEPRPAVEAGPPLRQPRIEPARPSPAPTAQARAQPAQRRQDRAPAALPAPARPETLPRPQRQAVRLAQRSAANRPRIEPSAASRPNRVRRPAVEQLATAAAVPRSPPQPLRSSPARLEPDPVRSRVAPSVRSAGGHAPATTAADLKSAAGSGPPKITPAAAIVAAEPAPSTAPGRPSLGSPSATSIARAGLQSRPEVALPASAESAMPGSAVTGEPTPTGQPGVPLEPNVERLARHASAMPVLEPAGPPSLGAAPNVAARAAATATPSRKTAGGPMPALAPGWPGASALARSGGTPALRVATAVPAMAVQPGSNPAGDAAPASGDTSLTAAATRPLRESEGPANVPGSAALDAPAGELAPGVPAAAVGSRRLAADAAAPPQLASPAEKGDLLAKTPPRALVGGMPRLIEPAGAAGAGQPSTAARFESLAGLPARSLSGPRLPTATPPGAAAFRPGIPLDVGIPSRRARPESEIVHAVVGRFVLQRAAGRADVDARVRRDASQAFRQRDPSTRLQVAQSHGGSPATERAVELGLDYLARAQLADGRWALDRLPPGDAADQAASTLGEMNADTAATGLALLAFLGAGYTHTDDKYRHVVRAGLDWLVANQQADGRLFTDQTDRDVYAQFYGHGIASIALGEAYGMTWDPDLREPVAGAIRFIVDSQHATRGGWRYHPNRESDTSVSGWQLMALKSAQMAGFEIPDEVLAGVAGWLDLAQSDNGARYRYNPYAMDNQTQRQGRVPNLAMTAEGLLMRIYLGWDRAHPAIQAGADRLALNLPQMGTTGQPRRDVYYWYYATQVMFQMQGEHWKAWNARLQPLLKSTQKQEGPLAGSWDPQAPVRDRWAQAGGRHYVTTLNLLMLEVYYRHLPLFRPLAE